MEDGRIVAINYTGKIVATDEVFESTVEKRAIDAGIFDEKQHYEPIVVIVGEGDVLRGLDNALREMIVGEQREVAVKPSDGWGERRPDNIAVVPLQQFRQRNITPVRGLVVELNGRQGRIQAVSGGRVRVDFNHPLAGKELLYELKIERELVQPKEQIEALYNKYFFMVPEKEKKLNIGDGEVEVSLSPRYSANIVPLKKLFSDIVSKHVKGFSKVRFVEEFVAEKEGEAEKTAVGKVKNESGKEKGSQENVAKAKGKKQ